MKCSHARKVIIREDWEEKAQRFRVRAQCVLCGELVLWTRTDTEFGPLEFGKGIARRDRGDPPLMYWST